MDEYFVVEEPRIYDTNIFVARQLCFVSVYAA